MKFLIRGGKKLSGKISVMGAKNSALKAMTAFLLFDSPIRLENMPLIEDVFRMAELLEGAGVKIEKKKERGFEIDPRGASGTELKKEIAERLRASIVLAGPLLARMGRGAFPHP